MALVSLISRQNQILKRSLLGAPSFWNTSIHSANSTILNNDLCVTKEIKVAISSFRNFSSQEPEKLVVNGHNDSMPNDVIMHPPNLKIHKKVISSPFYKMQKAQVAAVVIDDDTTGTNENDNDEEKGTAAATTTKVTISDKKKKVNKKEPVMYDLSTQLDRKIYAIPLPERLKVPILEFSSKEEVGTIHLSAHVFGQDPIREDILHRVVIYQRNKKRGKRKAKAKDRSEVQGSTRKIRQQKGTGRARAGSIRAPQRRGGGVAHGPRGGIQDYTTKLNKKVRNLGLRMALSQKLKEGNLVLVNSLALPSFKTKLFASALVKHDISGSHGTNAFILDWLPKSSKQDETQASANGVDANLLVASQNIQKVKVMHALTANVYDILKHEKLILSLAALETIEERFLNV